MAERNPVFESELQIRPTSGLSFPWVEYIPDGKMGSFDAVFSTEGCTITMLMIIHWEDLATALQELLGYSWRDTSFYPPRLRRNLPWKHPYSNQLWVRAISNVKGMQLDELELIPIIGFGGGAGVGVQDNTGPWSTYRYAILTLQFWRPPYFVRSDLDILDEDGLPQEWLRFVDKHWALDTQMLSRKSQGFRWVDLPVARAGAVTGSVGQALPKMGLIKRWYQIPEQALFQALVDSTPNGIPKNLLYTRTETVNPITGYVRTGGFDPVDGSAAGPTLPGCVNSSIGGGPFDADPKLRFFGCYQGTLLYLGVELIPQPLQMPASLMQIPIFRGNEAVAQQQYDVVFRFSLFDPPLGKNEFDRGHNLMPYSGDGQYYAVQTILGFDGEHPPFPGNEALTPFHYADFTDLFTIL